MIEQICAFIHNYFHGDRYAGKFTISGGTLEVEGLAYGQYFQICGSKMNDGVYTYPATDLADETFDGVVWDMRPPRAFLLLVAEIEAWEAKYGEYVAGPYQSESFKDYSYTLKTGSSTNGRADPNASTWRGVFRTRLNEWRKLA